MSRQRPDRSRRGGDEDEDSVEKAAMAAAAEETRTFDSAGRRFEAAAADDPALGGDPDHADVLRRLRGEPITAMGRVVYSSNAVFLLEMAGADPGHPDEPLRAIYKPVRGERPLWDFPRHTLHFREVASYLVSAALGDGLVPPTTLRDGPYGPGSVQLFIHGTTDLPSGQLPAMAGQLAGLAALDALLNNADRKRVHLLLGDDGRLRGIDNALSFLPYPRQRTVLIHLGGRPLDGPVARRVTGLATDADRRAELQERLSLLLDEDEVAAFAGRLERLAETRHYPVLDPWEGRPFEWW